MKDILKSDISCASTELFCLNSLSSYDEENKYSCFNIEMKIHSIARALR